MHTSPKIHKILIIQTAFLGDVILATPVIEKLHKHYPNAAIDFLVRKGNEGVLEGHPYLSELLVFDKKNKIKNIVKLIFRLRAKKYNLIINLQRFASSGIITSLARADVTIGFDKNPFSLFFSKTIKHIIGNKEHPKHEVKRNLELVEQFTDSSFEKPKLHLHEEELNKVRMYQNQKYICIAPTSIWFTKQYPREKWLALITALPKDINIYLLGAHSDQIVCNDLVKKSKRENIFNLAGKLSLKESAALMKGAILTYANDSAPLHLASSVNAPVCAVYCSTIPEFGFGPLSDFSRIIQTEETLTCRPCNLHGYKTCPLGHFKCAHTILNQQLLNAFEEAFLLNRT